MRSKLTILVAIAAVCVTTLWAGWGPEEQITTSDLYGDISPLVVVGSNNYRHVVWNSRDHANVHRYYQRWYPKSGWTSAYTIVSPAKYCAGNYALALDGNATDIHFAWQAYDGGSIAQRAYYAMCVPGTKGTGTWGKTIRLTPDRRTSAVDVVSFNDRVAVAFALDYASRPKGDTWQTNLEVGFKECIGKNWQATQYINPGFRAGGVSIAADAQARGGCDVYYLYQYNGNAYVMRRVGGVFQPAEVAATGVSQVTVEVDPGTGFPHIVCCCKPDGGPYRVYHTYRDPVDGWQQLAMVSEENSEYSTSPRMCFNGDQICVVWDDSTAGVHGIKYAFGGYGSWTGDWVTSGWSGWADGTPDVAAAPGGGLYCVWADGRQYPPLIWGSSYTPDGDGGNAQPVTLSQPSIELYPNPVKDRRVTVQYALPQAGEVAVNLLDVSGRLVRQSAICNLKSEMALDLKGLRPGVYILKLDVGASCVTRKLVIE